jgi:hypothetical protein
LTGGIQQLTVNFLLTTRMAFILFILSLCLSPARPAEDLNGIWKGNLSQGPGGCYPQYFLELQINFANNQIIGKAYDYYDTTKFIKMSFTGRYNPQTQRLVLIENKVLQSSIPTDCVPCIKTYDLTYSKKGQDEMLSGEWKGHIQDKSSACPPGKINLKKADHSDFPVDIEQSDTLALIQQTLQLQPRTKEISKTLIVDDSRIKIELYDDAEIDGDTVTVMINNKLLLYQQRLTDKPLVINFNAFPQTEYELTMYADNLGTIPPNTALMIVTAGNKRFEVYLSSSEQKTASVKFMYRKQP